MSGITLTVPFHKLSDQQVELVKNGEDIELSALNQRRNNFPKFINKIIDFISSVTSGFNHESLNKSFTEMNESRNHLDCRQSMVKINQELKYAKGVNVTYRCTKPNVSGNCEVNYYLNIPQKPPIFIRSISAPSESCYVQEQLLRQFQQEKAQLSVLELECQVEEIAELLQIEPDDSYALQEVHSLLSGNFNYSEDLYKAAKEVVNGLNKAGYVCSFESRCHGTPPVFSVYLITESSKDIRLRTIAHELKPSSYGYEDFVSSFDASGENGSDIPVLDSDAPVKYESCDYSELLKTMSKNLSEPWDYLLYEKSAFYEPLNEITGSNLSELTEAKCDECTVAMQKNGWNQGVRCEKVKHKDGVSYYMYLISNPSCKETSGQQKIPESRCLLVSFPTAKVDCSFSHKLA
ncbi:hypothetical protein SOPP22_04430 [Shewanella sp. OPT22]|nr:hypothetical protein SOPP22_04430 [Shewanella sp. OPT22]